VQRIFEVNTHFVNASDIPDHATRRVQSLHRLVTGCADLFHHTLVHFVLRMERENPLAGRIEDHLAERNPPQLLSFIEQPRDQLIDRRVRRSCSRGR
jgi:hypothetical protein